MRAPRKSLDGCDRKRIWLMRHAEVSYVTEKGTAVEDPRQVPLTETGIESARMTSEWLADVHFDRAICSGLPRTMQTARLVLGERTEPVLEVHPALEEIRGVRSKQWGDDEQKGDAPPPDADSMMHAVAYTFWQAGRSTGSFVGGEPYEQAAHRVQDTVAGILTEPNWHSALLICHGGVNRLILSWAIGAPLDCMGPFEQDPCCVNVIDFDLDANQQIRRATLRGVNISARDTFKLTRDRTTMEEVAVQVSAAQRARREQESQNS